MLPQNRPPRLLPADFRRLLRECKASFARAVSSVSLRNAVSSKLLLFFFRQFPNCRGRNPSDDSSRRNIFDDHRSRRHYGAVSDGNARYDNCAGTNPYIFADVNRLRIHGSTVTDPEIVVQSRKSHIMSDQRPVSDGDSSLILKMTAAV